MNITEIDTKTIELKRVWKDLNIYSTDGMNLLEDFTKTFQYLMKHISVLNEIDFSPFQKEK